MEVKLIKSLMEKGYKKYQYGEYQDALEVFNQATQLQAIENNPSLTKGIYKEIKKRIKKN